MSFNNFVKKLSEEQWSFVPSEMTIEKINELLEKDEFEPCDKEKLCFVLHYLILLQKMYYQPELRRCQREIRDILTNEMCKVKLGNIKEILLRVFKDASSN